MNNNRMDSYPNYPLFIEEAGITRQRVIDLLAESYPRFGKPTMTMVCNPDAYGVALTGNAEKKLIDEFGWHSGLLSRRKSYESKRKKKNRLYIRLDDALYSQLKEFYERTSFATMNDMVEAALVEFMNRRAT